MKKIVIDTNAVYCAVFSNGASSIIFDHIMNEKYKMLISNALLTEYESVLLRNCDNSQEIKDVNNILRFIMEHGEKVRVYYLYRLLAKNAKDAMVLETVMNGNADTLITFNKRHYYPIKNAKILTPGEFLKEESNDQN